VNYISDARSVTQLSVGAPFRKSGDSVILFGVSCMPKYACQLWSKHTQTSIWNAYELPTTMPTALCITYIEM